MPLSIRSHYFCGWFNFFSLYHTTITFFSLSCFTPFYSFLLFNFTSGRFYYLFSLFSRI
ncbi:hypothetical protein GLOIN_2v1688842 [Rhizophagus irregularis DAOM 181602=DAOM 197198]|uniref:Uncharacterized protein n=1 Tax=Rhizophagus irregularis (strain DAOM 181602 / DAOM 197198 / MUCL 43194) TaxID=747089 RepID=A0A2P4PCQ8_RHIID|nr:hypothetical protein GLOIN_2v1688842 [Rhizophagus irregularis DAOM 181602=DAOM 197198]POG63160.1 hypothetical protein GLOIN_2v1688842 [Rhizophagus irregularis DAOM 181602=DAOM 197198]|eukprot:XP_025170026.1 hypothetical protein GLOIN_2v1688842 [Rhizophagus irregularis DAOM 181602=DAOM 197198]